MAKLGQNAPRKKSTTQFHLDGPRLPSKIERVYVTSHHESVSEGVTTNVYSFTPKLKSFLPVPFEGRLSFDPIMPCMTGR
jgi:hypothetical protein